jgi:hypothetical protein
VRVAEISLSQLLLKEKQSRKYIIGRRIWGEKVFMGLKIYSKNALKFETFKILNFLTSQKS